MSALSRHILALGVTGMLVNGCQDLPEQIYETEHLRIGTDFDAPLCQGDLDHYENFISTLETELGTTVDKKIDVYLWDLREVQNPGWCEDGHAGCFSHGNVYAEVGSVEHELVHAVVDTFASPPRFWSEGVAESIQVWRTRFGSNSPSEDINKGLKDDVSYETAGHFSRWLIETYGMDLFRQLLRASGDGREAFESTYGIALEDAESAYYESAPHSYGAFVACEDLPLSQVDAQTWSESVEIDCSEPGIHGDFSGLFARRVVTITERGHYAISTSADIASISRCPDGTYDEAPTLDDPEQYGDLPEYTEQWFTGYGLGLQGQGEVRTLDLTPGRYRVVFGFESFEPNTATLEVTAAEGP